MQKSNGYYYGTEIDEKWWRRYMRDGLFTRGNGSWWIEDDGMYFLRKMTKKPIFIPLNAIKGIKLGTGHAGKWTPGATVLKVIWERNDMKLSSGFWLGWREDTATEIKGTLEQKIGR